MGTLWVAMWVGTASAATVNLNPSRDNTIFADLTANSNGAGDGFYAGKTATGSIRRGLVAFNLSSIPAGSTINSASLTLSMSHSISGSAVVALRRLNADWGQGTSAGSGAGAPATVGDATWLRRFYNTVSWTTAGGDFAASPSATQSVAGIANYTWSGSGLTADVQFWLDHPSSNFGWIVIGDESVNATAKKFDSREGATPPVLTIDYTRPYSVAGVTGRGLALMALAMAGVAAGFLRRQREA